MPCQLARPAAVITSGAVLLAPDCDWPRLPPLAISILLIACRTKSAQAGLPCRIHALFHTDKICCEPLTEWLHFADLCDGQPDYMVCLVRTIQALGVLVNSVCVELAAAHQPFTSLAARNKQLTDGIPYMLRNDSLVLFCQTGHDRAATLHCSCTALHRRYNQQDGTCMCAAAYCISRPVCKTALQVSLALGSPLGIA